MKVIDAAQPAVEEAGDASVSPGAGGGVNERRRHTHSAPSAHPGMAAAQGPVAPSSPEQVSHLPGGRAPSLVPGRLGGRTWGVGRGAEWSVPERGRRSQPERQTPAKVTQKVATVQRSRKSWLCGGGAGEENGGARAPPAQGSALRIKAALS